MTTAVYYGIILLTAAAGALMIGGYGSRWRCALVKRLKDRELKAGLSDGGADGCLFPDTAFKISKKRYESLRIAVLASGFAAGLACREGSIIIAAFIVSVSAQPIERVGRFLTPYGWICHNLRERKKLRIDEEIFEAMSFLKNIAASGRNSHSGSDSTIEQLAGYSDLLKPIYFRMLNLLRINRREEAIDYFAQAAGTRISRDFGRLLIRLDEISASELEETLLSYQKSIREVKVTRQKQQDEMTSDLLYLPVVINVMLIFINFIYVSYFIEQKNLFGVLAM